MPHHLKKILDQAQLENGTYKQVVTHLEKELELNGLEAPVELQGNIVSQHPTNTNADRPKPMCPHCKDKKPGQYRYQLSPAEQERARRRHTH